MKYVQKLDQQVILWLRQWLHDSSSKISEWPDHQVVEFDLNNHHVPVYLDGKQNSTLLWAPTSNLATKKKKSC